MWKRIFKKGKNDTISTCSCSIPTLLYIHPEIYQNLICKNAYIFSHTKETDSQISHITQNWLFKFYYKKAISLKRFLGSSHFKATEQNPSTANSLSIPCILLKWELLFTKIYNFY